jgi:hypothetical protein
LFQGKKEIKIHRKFCESERHITQKVHEREKKRAGARKERKVGTAIAVGAGLVCMQIFCQKRKK